MKRARTLCAATSASFLGLLALALGSTLVKAQQLAYVTNENVTTISVINTATNTVVATLPAASNPTGIALTAVGTRAYVAENSSLSVIDTPTNGVVATIGLPQSDSFGVAITPDGTRAYVANSDFASNSFVSAIDTTTNTVVANVPVGVGPVGVAITPDGARVYVASFFGNSVSVVATATNTVVATVPASNPAWVAITPDGTRGYVTTFGSQSVSVIDTSTNTVITSIPIPIAYGITGVAITPDGTRAYVANGAGSVLVIDTATNTLVATISVGATAVAITPDGTLAYVADLNSSVASVINTTTNSVVAIVPVGSEPIGVAITHPITVAIDIKPGEDPPSINVKSQGKIPVAILSNSVFNALTGVDPTSLTFGRTGTEGSLVSCDTGGQDVNGDGLLDLVCRFNTQKSAFQNGDTMGIVKGKTTSGIAIAGMDSVVVQ